MTSSEQNVSQTDLKPDSKSVFNSSKTIIVELNHNGVRQNKEINAAVLKTAGDILKELKINEETALLFFKDGPVPLDEKIADIGIENIRDGDFKVLKVIFDE